MKSSLPIISRAIRGIALFLFLIFSSSTVQAQVLIPVTVTIMRVIELHCDEGFGESCPNDFYAKVNIANLGYQESPIVYNNSDFSPFWTFTRQVDVANGTVPINIQLWDQDDLSADDQIDISSGDGGDRTLNLVYDLTTGNWWGEVPLNVGYSQGSGNDSASITFDITLNSDGDLDDDGIPDGIERFGILDANGNLHTDMAALGADPCRKTIAIEIDFMEAGDHDHEPDAIAITEAVNAFNAAPVPAVSFCPYAGFPTQASGIGLIVIVDDAIVEQPDLNFDNAGWTAFNTIRANNFDAARQPYFHYSLWAHNLNANDGTSGVCCSGKDFIVSLGSWTNQTGTARQQSGTFMHELGHAIGLGHGGGDGVNFKPNYLSVMNYQFQTVGIIDSATGVSQIDYSLTALPNLIETSLFEPTGIGDGTLTTFWRTINFTLLSSPGNIPLDWTGNDFDGNGIGNDDTNVTVDINGDRICVTPGNDGVLNTTPAGDDLVVGNNIHDGPNRTCNSNATGDDRQERAVGHTQVAVLTGYDDWANLKYRAAMSPDAGYSPPPIGPELNYETALLIEEQANQAINTTDLAISKNALPTPVLNSNVASVNTSLNHLPFSIYLPLVGNIMSQDSLITAAAGTQMDYVITITNNGPNSTHEAQVIDVLPDGVTYISDNADCVEAPVRTLTCDPGLISADESRDILVTVLIDPDLVYNAGGPVAITNHVTVENVAGLDLYQDNNSAFVEVQVVAVADLEIVDYEVLNPPPQIMVGEAVTVTLRKVITNNGPSAPMDVSLIDTATAPPDSTITPTEIHVNELALALGEQRTIEEVFTLQCNGYSHHIFTFTTEIQPLNSEDSDPDLSNNQAEISLDIECVVPIAINIVPGQINLNGNGVVPVLALNNAAGEFGLPLAFDASTIDPLSVRFGPRDVIWEGTGGALETHGQGHGHGQGMLLHFRIQETGLSVTDNEACLKGTWYDEDGDPHTFFGCDAVVIRD